ncbi:MAG: hypothetical protein Q7U98_01395 [Methylicorpusculum sp.]|uniref:hypothetical protein n=1 Tax=Methylicorpusculum sp. TaxID=2713644 RepID=UPI00271E395E|nr:hypothetical protein [Methylicorpusculum sp.]MDO8937793.1 hypothetical protein [Methylicorpusculum sp.]MDP2201926.1 hypothetical protein [Methylicorpusculum sp.]
MDGERRTHPCGLDSGNPPAFPDRVGSEGTTLLLKHLYNQEFLYRSGFYLKAELLFPRLD